MMQCNYSNVHKVSTVSNDASMSLLASVKVPNIYINKRQRVYAHTCVCVRERPKATTLKKTIYNDYQNMIATTRIFGEAYNIHGS